MLSIVAVFFAVVTVMVNDDVQIASCRTRYYLGFDRRKERPCTASLITIPNVVSSVLLVVIDDA